MKIFIGWKNNIVIPQNQIYFYEQSNLLKWLVPHQRSPLFFLENSFGWKFISITEIEEVGDIKKAIIAKFGEEPDVILFWLILPFIYKHIKSINQIKCKKYYFIDDLHNNECKINKIISYKVFNSMDIIFSSYAYIFHKYYPEINKNKIKWLPHSVFDNFKVNINNTPIKKVLLSGFINKEIYPARYHLLNLSKKYDIDVLHHPGHDNLKNKLDTYVGKDYIIHMNKYIACFTCCASKKFSYIVNKFFEIPMSGSLLLAFDEYIKNEMIELGFIDGENYISVTFDNMEEKIKYVLDENNRKEIDKIRINGYNLVNSKHLQYHRALFINNLDN